MPGTSAGGAWCLYTSMNSPAASHGFKHNPSSADLCTRGYRMSRSKMTGIGRGMGSHRFVYLEAGGCPPLRIPPKHGTERNPLPISVPVVKEQAMESSLF